MKIERHTVRINMKAGLEVEKTVPSYEANLLAAIHGEDSVSQVASEIFDADFDARQEWEALLRKYGTATNEEGKQYVRLVYPSAHALGSYVDRTAPRSRSKPAENHAAA